MTQQGSQFRNEIKYSADQWSEWKENRAENIYVGSYGDEPQLELVYVVNDEKKTLDHVATYNKKEQILFCDDADMFNITLKIIAEIANTFYDSNKKRYVSNLYWKLYAAGMKPAILNDLYLEIDGVTYEFINHRKEMYYSVKPFPKSWMQK